MDQVFLPGTIRDRIKDLMKSKKMTQAELAVRIGTAESTLSRFLRGDTDKLGNENIIRIARMFNVSTDFLLGEVDVPDRMNYDISELGLSVQAARNLYTHKVNPQIVNGFKLHNELPIILVIRKQEVNTYVTRRKGESKN